MERQLTTAQSRHQDYEDAILQTEREKASWVRQLEVAKKQLETETEKRTQLEQTISSHNSEIIKFKDRITKLEKELKKALDEIHNRDWEISQLRSKQDKTIVEHVHVLEEAKKVTDRQLADAQLELQSQVSYIRSLEKTKLRLSGEAEDLAREVERERGELRAKAKIIRQQEERSQKALNELEKERKAKDATEIQVRKLQLDVKNSQTQLADVTQQLEVVKKAKAHLETELATLAAETDSQSALPKLHRQYESRVNQLEAQLEEAELARTTAERIKERIDQQHAEIRRLINSGGHKDDAFRIRLLKELQLFDEGLARDLSRPGSPRKPNIQTLVNVTPTKRSSAELNGILRSRRESLPVEVPRTPDRQVSALKQQVQVLEVRMMASERVRQHLEASLRDLTADFENNDGSKQALQAHKDRLAHEKARLTELLEDEADARRAAEAAQMGGVKAMWEKFQNTITAERSSYAKLEDSRKALVQCLSFHFDNTRQIERLLACSTTGCYD